MKKSTVWLLVGIASLMLMTIVGFCGLATMGSSTNPGTVVGAVDGSKIDLEKLTRAFERHVQRGAKDLNGFEAAINDRSQGIYEGSEPIKVTMIESGAVVGYLNKDPAPTYAPGKDEKVFELNIDEKNKQVVARDRGDNYYRYQPSFGGFFTGMLIGNMLSGHRSYYPRGSYSAPPAARYRRSGYYNRAKSAARRSGSSFRSGSRTFGRSGSRSGGFGFGK